MGKEMCGLIDKWLWGKWGTLGHASVNRECWIQNVPKEEVEREQVRSLSYHFSRNLCAVAPTFSYVHPSAGNVPLRDVWTLLLGGDEVGRSTSEGTERTNLQRDLLHWEQTYWILIANVVMILEAKSLISPSLDISRGLELSKKILGILPALKSLSFWCPHWCTVKSGVGQMEQYWKSSI